MKKVVIIMVLALAFYACKTETKKTETPKAEPQTIESIALADFDAKAGSWVGKEVKVTGIVDHVCKHGGKRLFLVDNDADVHIDSDTRFDDALQGNEITVKGIVKEFRIDEAYCLQKEQDFIQKHKEGVDAEEVYKKKMKHIQAYRDSMKTAGIDHLSFYTLDYVSHDIIK